MAGFEPGSSGLGINRSVVKIHFQWSSLCFYLLSVCAHLLLVLIIYAYLIISYDNITKLLRS